MDRPKHHWLILLGLALVSCGAVLLGLQWLQPKSDDGNQPPVTTVQFPARSPAPAQSQPVAAPATEEPTGALLRGQVIDAETREPIEQFEIQLQLLQHDLEVEPPPVTRTFRSGSGRFAWQDAPPGMWRFVLVAADHQHFQIEGLSIAAGQQTRELLVPLLRGYNVTGRVFEQRSGAGIPNASIFFVESGDAFRNRGGVKSKKDGAFVLDGVPPGRVTLSVLSMEHAQREVDIVVSERTPPVEIGLSTGASISGFLVTSGGAPLVGPVTLVNEQNFSFRKRTDETGAFSFGKLSAGRYRIGTDTGWQDIVLGPDERRENIFVTSTVSPGRAVRGSVKGLPPDALERTFVTLQSDSRGLVAMRPLEKDGTFVLRGAPAGPGLLRLDIESGNRTLVRAIEVPAHKDLLVDIEFAAGVRVSGRVTQGGKPVVAGRGVWIAPFAGQEGSFYHARTADGGTYRVDDVPAGDYQIHAEGGAIRRVAITDDTAIDIDLPVTQLGGRVLEKEGSVPIVGAVVFATMLKSPVSGARPYTSANHFGEFQLTGLEPGDVVVSAYKPGYELFRERIAYASPVTDMTLRLNPGSGVEIKAHVARGGAVVRQIEVVERLDGGHLGVILQIRLDEDGAGLLPGGLAGSTLEISGGGRTSVVPKWDGQALGVQLR